eukprot:3970263-Pyramimonas_sp.AAC.1
MPRFTLEEGVRDAERDRRLALLLPVRFPVGAQALHVAKKAGSEQACRAPPGDVESRSDPGITAALGAGDVNAAND